MKDSFLYGLLSYNSINIGDEIQSIAASRFLPRVDEYVYREQINKFVPKIKRDKLVKVICNAWWMWRYKNFPPSKHIMPLLIAMHIRPEIRKKILKAKTIDFFKKNAPVGCRDISTMNWLQSIGVPAYFSGCLTLTLQRNNDIPRGNYILCVDVDEQVVQKIKKVTNRPVFSISRMISQDYTMQERLEIAKLVLRLYHDAHLVVSSALHVVLPSLALQTPVLFIIPQEDILGGTSRFEGYEGFLNTIDLSDDINKIQDYDFENPLANPDKYLDIREKLIKTCSDFTGYNNEKSLIDADIYPLAKMMELNKYSYKKVKKNAYWLKKIDLLRIFIFKILGGTQYDLNHNMLSNNFSLKNKIKNLVNLKYKLWR